MPSKKGKKEGSKKKKALADIGGGDPAIATLDSKEPRPPSECAAKKGKKGGSKKKKALAEKRDGIDGGVSPAIATSEEPGPPDCAAQVTAPPTAAESKTVQANAQEQEKRKEALKAAKEAWKDAPAESKVNKHVIADQKNGMIFIRQHELPEHPVLHLTQLDNCTIKIASVSLVKILVERCHGCTIEMTDVSLMTSTVEIWACERRVALHCNRTIGTLQVDICQEVHLEMSHAPEEFGQLVQAGVHDMTVHFTQNAAHNFRTGLKHLVDLHEGLVLDDKTTQFVTRYVQDKFLTEELLRLANEFPTTAREQHKFHGKRREIDRLAELVGHGDALTPEEKEELRKLREENRYVEGEVEVSAELRAEKRRLKGNAAFKEGNIPQAAVFYTEVLQILPNDAPTLANRALCFLRLDKPAEALADADACLAIDPTYVKAHFRRGMALAILNRHVEAGQAFSVVLEKEPKNKQARDCFAMAQMKAARERGELANHRFRNN